LHPTHVLKLLKTLYKLKQSIRIWLNILKEILVNKLGFKTLISESSIFINKSINIIIYIYINDLIVISPSKEVYNTFIKDIKKHFKIKELGLIKDYLRVEIDYKPDQGYMKLYMAKYINKKLDKFGFNDLNPVSTPMDPKIKLEPNKDQATTKNIKYYQ
jgi:hypothetical protein